jgi:hypothetical protein
MIKEPTSIIAAFAVRVREGRAGWWEAVSKQQVLGPADHLKARATQAATCEIKAQQRAIKSRNARQRADHDRELRWHALAEQDHDGKAKAAR